MSKDNVDAIEYLKALTLVSTKSTILPSDILKQTLDKSVLGITLPQLLTGAGRSV